MENPFKPINARGKSTPSDQFIGAYIPEELAEHISLLALFRGLPKVAIFKKALQLYAAAVPISTIIPYLITRTSETWRSQLRINAGKDGWKTAAEKEENLILFKKELRIYLKNKIALSHTRISEILDKVK